MSAQARVCYEHSSYFYFIPQYLSHKNTDAYSIPIHNRHQCTIEHRTDTPDSLHSLPTWILHKLYMKSGSTRKRAAYGDAKHRYRRLPYSVMCIVEIEACPIPVYLLLIHTQDHLIPPLAVPRSGRRHRVAQRGICQAPRSLSMYDGSHTD